MADLRHLSLEGTICYIVTDADAGQVRILAVFPGVQDHRRHMRLRLLPPLA